MFHRLIYRFVPFVVGLTSGVPGRRGGSSEGFIPPDLGDSPGAGFHDVSDRPDRGDVPGWVLITLMTAGLVVALWALAGEAFTSMFQDAMNKVRGAG